jgi:hypothetical protein
VLHATFARVAEEDVARLRSWLDSLSARRSELRESYRQQGTQHELFFLIRAPDTPILVLISQVENIEHASSSFLRSNLPLDLEFKTLVKEMSQSIAGVELLYDSSQHLAGPAS